MGQGDGMVFGGVHRAEEQTEVDQPPVQLFTDVPAVAAGDVEADVGEGLLQRPGRFREEVDPYGLSGADVDVSGQGLVLLREFLLGFPDQVQNLLRPLAQQYPLRGQGEAVASPDKEGMAQSGFQVPDLPGEGGLGDVEDVGGIGHAALSGDGEKIVQDPQFHKLPPVRMMIGTV